MRTVAVWGCGVIRGLQDDEVLVAGVRFDKCLGSESTSMGVVERCAVLCLDGHLTVRIRG